MTAPSAAKSDSRAADRSPQPCREVAPGIVQVDCPVPFRGLRQVNVWLLRERDGWTMIDCGYGNDIVRSRLEEAWAEVLGGLPVRRLIVTHFHPDHVGNARWVTERWGIVAAMTQQEWMSAALAVRDEFTDSVEGRARLYQRNGLSPERLARFRAEVVLYSKGVRLPDMYRRLRDGRTVTIGDDSWRVITGSGHSPELAGFHCAARDLYISGDQVLPRISTNVSVWPGEPEAEPLADFLASLDRIEAEIADTVLVLPSHGNPFHGLHRRIAELRQHHAARLGLLRDFVRGAGSVSAGETLDVLFSGELDGHQIGFAMGEALAHLNHLVGEGSLERRSSDGLVRFVWRGGDAAAGRARQAT